jgi:hypothetical protein
VGFETTIPVFERAKAVHALDCEGTVTGIQMYTVSKIVTSEKYTERGIKIDQYDHEMEPIVISGFKEEHKMSVNLRDYPFKKTVLIITIT